ncbi:hypothetical protein BD410DRAFT_321847 [Rickenella mellea]|uniref:Uncharacterized protein n=1 Tax=Rickenella mellea TaxID=50990 RepID=A0A4Y7Q2D5_9AGAM|nr:hypothetical protein BD410DRAFT_321847 [Rickenella mellea]
MHTRSRSTGNDDTDSDDYDSHPNAKADDDDDEDSDDAPLASLLLPKRPGTAMSAMSTATASSSISRATAAAKGKAKPLIDLSIQANPFTGKPILDSPPLPVMGGLGGGLVNDQRRMEEELERAREMREERAREMKAEREREREREEREAREMREREEREKRGLSPTNISDRLSQLALTAGLGLSGSGGGSASGSASGGSANGSATTSATEKGGLVSTTQAMFTAEDADGDDDDDDDEADADINTKAEVLAEEEGEGTQKVADASPERTVRLVTKSREADGDADGARQGEEERRGRGGLRGDVEEGKNGPMPAITTSTTSATATATATASTSTITPSPSPIPSMRVNVQRPRQPIPSRRVTSNSLLDRERSASPVSPRRLSASLLAMEAEGLSASSSTTNPSTSSNAVLVSVQRPLISRREEGSGSGPDADGPDANRVEQQKSTKRERERERGVAQKRSTASLAASLATTLEFGEDREDDFRSRSGTSRGVESRASTSSSSAGSSAETNKTKRPIPVRDRKDPSDSGFRVVSRPARSRTDPVLAGGAMASQQASPTMTATSSQSQSSPPIPTAVRVRPTASSFSVTSRPLSTASSLDEPALRTTTRPAHATSASSVSASPPKIRPSILSNSSSSPGSSPGVYPRQRSTTLNSLYLPTQPPARPFAESTRRESPASSTGGSSSGKAPLTPRDGSDYFVPDVRGQGQNNSVERDSPVGTPSAMKGGRGHVKRASVTFQEPFDMDAEGVRVRDRERRGSESQGVDGEVRRRERRRSEAKAAIDVSDLFF